MLINDISFFQFVMNKNLIIVCFDVWMNIDIDERQNQVSVKKICVLLEGLAVARSGGLVER
jgi:hypothetical protein